MNILIELSCKILVLFHKYIPISYFSCLFSRDKISVKILVIKLNLLSKHFNIEMQILYLYKLHFFGESFLKIKTVSQSLTCIKSECEPCTTGVDH